MLLRTAETAGWHTFGMEWKEHAAWFAPILSTMVAALATMYGRSLARKAMTAIAVILISIGFAATLPPSFQLAQR